MAEESTLRGNSRTIVYDDLTSNLKTLGVKGQLIFTTPIACAQAA